MVFSMPGIPMRMTPIFVRSNKSLTYSSALEVSLSDSSIIKSSTNS